MCKFISQNILVGRDRRASRSRRRLGELCLTWKAASRLNREK